MDNHSTGPGIDQSKTIQAKSMKFGIKLREVRPYKNQLSNIKEFEERRPFMITIEAVRKEAERRCHVLIPETDTFYEHYFSNHQAAKKFYESLDDMQASFEVLAAEMLKLALFQAGFENTLDGMADRLENNPTAKRNKYHRG
jgi:hypothetical protein